MNRDINIKPFEETTFDDRHLYFTLHQKGVINLSNYWNSFDTVIDEEGYSNTIIFKEDGRSFEIIKGKDSADIYAHKHGGCDNYTVEKPAFIKTDGRDDTGWVTDDKNHIYFKDRNGHITYV